MFYALFTLCNFSWNNFMRYAPFVWKINRIVKQFKLFRTNVLRYKSFSHIFACFWPNFDWVLLEVNVEAHLIAQNRNARNILHKTDSFYNFEMDFMPKMSISRHFGPFLTKIWPKTRYNEHQNTFLCPKSDFSWNFT